MQKRADIAQVRAVAAEQRIQVKADPVYPQWRKKRLFKLLDRRQVFCDRSFFDVGDVEKAAPVSYINAFSKHFHPELVKFSGSGIEGFRIRLVGDQIIALIVENPSNSTAQVVIVFDRKTTGPFGKVRKAR